MKKKFSIHIPSSSLPTLLSISTWSARPRKKLIANSKKIIEKKQNKTNLSIVGIVRGIDELKR